MDIIRESLIPFGVLAHEIPPSRGGRPVAVSTLHRWRLHGSLGVKLEAVCIGGRWYCSREAFQRWCDAVTARRTRTLPATNSSPSSGDAAIDTALKAMGFGPD